MRMTLSSHLLVDVWKSLQTAATPELWPHSPRGDSASGGANTPSSLRLLPSALTAPSAIVEIKRRLQYAGNHTASCERVEIIRHLGHQTGRSRNSRSFEMPCGENECWLDSVTFHYCCPCLPKIKEDASANILGDLGATTSRSSWP